MSSLKDLIHTIVESLVDHPDKIKIEEFGGEQSRVIEVTVAKEDVGKIIGRSGKTADAIRTIIYAISGKAKTRTVLQIVDYKG